MKTTFKNKKAFTLIELLIVIAIIGILFIVLVSKVDFATDKAKATGVQTDFRSFQMAFETVARENAGFNTFGWDTGDLNADGKRNSYDEGDTNRNGVRDDGETWVGRKTYAENWTSIYTLKKPGTNTYDAGAIFKLESAINKNLDPKLHITIDTDGNITMANQAQDPWKKEYHGKYMSNANVDGKDRGVIIIYSDGANGEYGSADGVAGGLVNITTPGNNVQGKDDYAVATFYSYANGYGEVVTITHGFSNNQSFGNASNVPTSNAASTINSYSWSELKTIAQAGLTAEEYKSQYGIELGQMKDGKYMLVDFDNYGGFVFMYNTGVTAEMNSTDTNAGGYAASELATQVEAFYTNLSDANLKSAIKQVTITCNDGNANVDDAHTYTCHMFLAAHRELGGTTFESHSYEEYLDAEGTPFDYFTSDAARASVGSADDYYWTRSCAPNSDIGFFFIDITGESEDSCKANSDLYIVPCFVIG